MQPLEGSGFNFINVNTLFPNVLETYHAFLLGIFARIWKKVVPMNDQFNI